MTILRIRLVVWITHQGVILQDVLPILLIFAVSGTLTCELLDSNLVAVKVLKDQVIKVWIL